MTVVACVRRHASADALIFMYSAWRVDFCDSYFILRAKTCVLKADAAGWTSTCFAPKQPIKFIVKHVV